MCRTREPTRLEDLRGPFPFDGSHDCPCLFDCLGSGCQGCLGNTAIISGLAKIEQEVIVSPRLALVWDHGSADHRQPIVIAFASQGAEEKLGEEELETLVELDELPVTPGAADGAMADDGAWLDEVPPIAVDAGLPDEFPPEPLAAGIDDAESSLDLVHRGQRHEQQGGEEREVGFMASVSSGEA